MKNSGNTKNIFKSNPFHNLANQYDNWYEENWEIYQAELNLLKKVVPEKGVGLEVGVGTGRFAPFLGAKFGIDLAFSPLKKAKSRGVLTVQAKAEALPFKSSSFDFVLFITTICFLKQPLKAFKEAHRILKEKGRVIIGFINRESPLGKKYEKKKQKSPFYAEARFYAPYEIQKIFQETGFKFLNMEEILEGFAVISGEKIS